MWFRVMMILKILRAMRFVLGVNRFTPTHALCGELAWRRKNCCMRIRNLSFRVLLPTTDRCCF